jgi:hypothetical protein
MAAVQEIGVPAGTDQVNRAAPVQFVADPMDPCLSRVAEYHPSGMECLPVAVRGQPAGHMRSFRGPGPATRRFSLCGGLGVV